ncbi:hemerythrin family protein [Clostridium sp. UBA5119]|uniref:bacteriohemerythrin n=1 Tax=Clostridium sp. UBA5119 TaxID=1946366 RepID=UPI0032168E4E
MFDFKFDWQDDLNTNIERIDEQHKELFKIARKIEQLLITKCATVDSKILLDIICELREYISYSFYEEEKIMKEANYFNYEEHIKSHEELKKVIMNIELSVLKERPCEELKKIKDSVQDWIFQHMMIEDKAMAEEILKSPTYI